VKTRLEIIKEAQQVIKTKNDLPSMIISNRDKDGKGYRLSACIKIMEKDLIITPKDDKIITMEKGDPVLHIEQMGRYWSKTEALELRDFITECFGE
jgi:hypothetical protein